MLIYVYVYIYIPDFLSHPLPRQVTKAPFVVLFVLLEPSPLRLASHSDRKTPLDLWVSVGTLWKSDFRWILSGWWF